MTMTARMVRRRRKGPQLEMGYPKVDKNGQLRGGKRVGAGRPRKNPALELRPKGKGYVRHVTRAKVDPRHPQHVTLTVLEDISHLRSRDLYAAVKVALRVAGKWPDFRIVHFSVQGNHIHLLVEADGKKALGRGMKSFEISLGKRINAVMTWKLRRRRKGQVFADRYHVKAITSVRGTRNALCYILNNWRHHPRSARGRLLLDGKLDPYSSAIWFAGWKERTVPEIHIPPDYEPPFVRPPRTWFLQKGWKLARPISCYEVPGDQVGGRAA
jgi:REP element-mobilizing transposase RayT